MEKKTIIISLRQKNTEYLLQNIYVCVKIQHNVEYCGNLCTYYPKSKRNLHSNKKQKPMNRKTFFCDSIEQEKKETMQKIVGAANFIIQHFIKCDGTYSCSKTKLEKLLAIANLKFLKDGRQIFDNAILTRRCGVGIDIEFPRYLCGDVVIGTSSVEHESKIELDCFQPDLPYSSIYDTYVNILSNEEKDVLREVFFTFGGYKRETLGEWLNEFKEFLVDKPGVDEPISMEKCREFFKYKPSIQNLIINYIVGDN